MPLVQACFEGNVVLLSELCGQREDVNALVGILYVYLCWEVSFGPLLHLRVLYISLEGRHLIIACVSGYKWCKLDVFDYMVSRCLLGC